MKMVNTQAYRDKDRQYLWHPYSRHSAIQDKPFPVITRGEGVYLFDSDGNRYVDAVSSWWACNLGHNHPRLVNAIVQQVSKLQHSILGNLSHPMAIELSAGIAGLFGKSGRRVFFSGDGACAVEAALKIALQYWYNLGSADRNQFVSLENAYHGDTLGAVSVGYLESFHLPFQPLLFPAHRAASPCCGLCQWSKTPDSCGQECFESIKKIIQTHQAQIAAVIVEPLCQAAAGMRIYSPEYLKKLAALCRETDVLLIVDEIAMGFGRTGKMFAFEHAGIDPDIVCLGKGLSGGYIPISATVVKEGIYETFQDTPVDHTFYHGHTFAGNPIAAAAALETLNVYEDDHIVQQAERLGSVLQKQMSRFIGLDGIRDVRCLGMIAAVELENETRDNNLTRARKIQQELLKRGILIRPLGNVLYLMPPLITPEKILVEMVNTMYETVQAET